MIYDKSFKRFAQFEAVPSQMVQLIWNMPGDADIDPALWQRLGEGPEWERFYSDIEAAGGSVEDTEDIVMTCPASSVSTITDIVMSALSGQYGPDVEAYWTYADFVGESDVAI
jgi:hypothetical protein